MRYTLSFLAALAGTALAAEAIQARDACSDACLTAWDACRGKPEANMASCASDYAGCVGYNPWESGGFVTPTACSKSAMPSSTSAAPTPAPPAPTNACVAACDAAYDACRGKPGANMASCASDYAGCVGYNPWESGSYVQPTACSAVPSMSSAKPNATGTGTVPATYPPATSKPVQVAGAASLKPIMGLIAVGALAFL
jgi:hypothetical protein